MLHLGPKLLACIALLLVLNGCRGITGESAPPPEQPAGITSINHVVIMLQENRSFDHYFGKLGEYRAMTGAGLASDIDGLPPNASNPADDGTEIFSFEMGSMCMENVTPAWNEAWGQMNRWNPGSDEFLMDGFVHTAAGMAQCCLVNPHDFQGVRAMGYYDWDALPYYYFMATQFATSDRFFAPVPAKSEINRLYMHAATSAGRAKTPDLLSVKTIWHLLEENSVTWKIYVPDINPTFGTLPRSTYLGLFFDPAFAEQHADKIVPVEQYFADVAAGTLPSVAFIEGPYFSGRDEHPGGNTPGNPDQYTHVQRGAAFVASLINALMNSPSWKDSVFFLSYDEGGGLYDHVVPPPAVHPDGIAPVDLTEPNDVQQDFIRMGLRIPLIVVSPFAKKNYVSHTNMDFTAFLKFIEARFQLPTLTRRDAAQPDMSEFFDFTNPPWMTPPSPPAQPTNGACYVDRFP